MQLHVNCHGHIGKKFLQVNIYIIQGPASYYRVLIPVYIMTSVADMRMINIDMKSFVNGDTT